MKKNKYRVVLILGLNCGKKVYNFIDSISEVEIISVYALHPNLSKNIAGFLDFGKFTNPKIFSYYNKLEDIEKKIISDKKIDLIVALGISSIIGKKLLNIPKYGCLGGHAAKLPERPGSAPVVWAILDNLKVTEMTIFRMSEKIDEGPIYGNIKIPIKRNMNAGDLRSKMDDVLLKLMKKHFLDIISGKNRGKIIMGKRNYTRKRGVKDGQLDFNDSADNILRKIRALSSPYPGAHFYGSDGKAIIIDKAKQGEKDLNYLGSGNNYKNKVLCIVAHPDDEALGVGGTLIKHATQGDNVNIIILSEGEDAKSKNNKKNPYRKSNALKWANIASCNLYALYDFPDQRLDAIPQLDIVKKLEQAIETLKPNILYIHHPGDMNSDHQIAAQVALAAVRPMSYHKVSPEIRAFETPSSTDQGPMTEPYIFKPNFYVSIDKYWQKKMDGLEVYSSEIKKAPHPRSILSIKSLAIKRGAESGFKMAEAFFIIKKIWD